MPYCFFSFFYGSLQLAAKYVTNCPVIDTGNKSLYVFHLFVKCRFRSSDNHSLKHSFFIKLGIGCLDKYTPIISFGYFFGHYSQLWNAYA